MVYGIKKDQNCIIEARSLAGVTITNMQSKQPINGYENQRKLTSFFQCLRLTVVTSTEAKLSYVP